MQCNPLVTHACKSSWQLLDWMHRKFRNGEPLREFSTGMNIMYLYAPILSRCSLNISSINEII